MSPVTEALWAKLPFPPWFPISIYFLALSQAPPLFAINIASIIPVINVPANIPPRASAPNKNPTTNGDAIAKNAGTIISLRAAVVEILTHLA